MRVFKKLLSALCVLVIMCSLIPVSFADSEMDAKFKDKTWEEVVTAFMEEYFTDPERVSMGYCNLITGEEHYWRGDKYMVSGSMFKVPLNMYYTEKVYNGEMDWDTKIQNVQYQRLLEMTIINSDNNMSEFLWKNIGTYRRYRELICPYMGVDAETVDAKYYENNFFTAEQMLHCLKLLYNEQERFPRLIDTMKQAEPKNYFNYHEQDYEIAHKYGYFVEGYKLYMNDCAICFTDDPIAIVLFTDTIKQPYEMMADFCTLMCDYTQYHTERRREQEREQAEAAAIEQLNSSAPVNSAAPATPTVGTVDTAPVTPAAPEKSGSSSTLIVLIVLLFALAVIVVIFAGRKQKINAPWALAAAVFGFAALLLSIVGMKYGTVITKPSGNPAEIVSGFYDAIIAGDYEKAYSYLDDYASLGLEKQPETDAGQQVYQALQDSYSYKLHGESEIEGLSAKQQVLFTYLDLDLLNAPLEEETNAVLERLVRELPRAEIYDENNNYLPAVTDRAYAEAIASIIDNAPNCYTVAGLEIDLVYTANGWKIVTNNAMLKAISGGAA